MLRGGLSPKNIVVKQSFGINPYGSNKGDTSSFVLNKTGNNMEINRMIAPPELPKVFSDKVKEETEKIKKQLGMPGN